jgi:hypothetical protein
MGMKVTEIITLYGATDGSSTTGTFTLFSDAFDGGITAIKLDKGLKAKIWAKEISGEPVKIYIDVSYDGGSSWITLDTEELVSAGQLNLEKRRPRIILFRTGNEQIRVRWEQDTAGLSYVVLDLEVEPAE